MKLKSKFLLAGLILAVLGAMLPVQSDATIMPFTSRAEFPDNNSVDWAQLGPFNTVVPSGTVVNAAFFGTTVTVSTDIGTNLVRRDQNPGDAWAGNFTPGDALIWTSNFNDAALILDFSTNIWGGGAQIQRDLSGGFTATLAAYDAGLNFLGSLNLNGNSTFAADNSAIFIGIFSTDSNIRRLVFSVDGQTQDFAINKLEFLQCPPAVPLPGSLLLLASGLLGLVGLRRKN